MGYKEKSWSTYRKKADIVEFTIRDPTRKKVDFLRASNNKDLRTCLGILKKYGFDANEGRRTNEEEKEEDLKKEKDWLDPDLKW